MPATPPRNSRTLHRRTAVPTPNGCAASPPATSQAIALFAGLGRPGRFGRVREARLAAAIWAVAALTAISGIVVALRMYETHTTSRRAPATSQVSART